MLGLTSVEPELEAQVEQGKAGVETVQSRGGQTEAGGPHVAR